MTKPPQWYCPIRHEECMKKKCMWWNRFWLDHNGNEIKDCVIVLAKTAPFLGDEH